MTYDAVCALCIVIPPRAGFVVVGSFNKSVVVDEILFFSR